MKIKLLIIFALVSLTFMSCSHDIEVVSLEALAKAKFEKSFLNAFGEIDPTQDWGFNESITVFDFTDRADSRGMTRGHNVNRNQWADMFVLPPTVTHAEEVAVINYLATLSTADNPQNIDCKPTVDWKDFFVFHVHKGTDNYRDHSGGNIGVASNHMNHLQVIYSNGTMEHVNDFNHGGNPAHGNSYEAATYMLNSTTFDFAYHNSTDNKYHSEYTVIDGANIGYDGFYYICFDFLANGDIEQPANKNMGVDRNYNYTDWIVRICPATFNMEGATRIIAEDLGASNSDFDYNDVVFDVKLANEYVENEGNKLVGYFVVRAAGGTLPLTVAGNEVHDLFGVDTDVMVNTNNGTVTKEPAQFVAILGDADWNTPGATLVKNIPVAVTTAHGTILLETETGNAPEKIAVEPRYEWCFEKEPIQTKYNLFPKWVQDRKTIWY